MVHWWTYFWDNLNKSIPFPLDSNLKILDAKRLLIFT